MAREHEPSYTDLVYEVLQSSPGPLALSEILQAVNERRPIATANPKSTIRGALHQGRSLVSLGKGLYGYLPTLLEGSLLRLPLTEKKPANHPLIFTPELSVALWPTSDEPAKRRNDGPVRVRLPSGEEVTLGRHFLGLGTWGSSIPEPLRHYLVQNRAAAGDSLLIRVVDAKTQLYEARFEAQRHRDAAAVAARNREIGEAAAEFVCRKRSSVVLVWEIASYLLAKGYYKAGVAPDPLETLLSSDRRLGTSGYGVWMTAEEAAERGDELRLAFERVFSQDTDDLLTDAFVPDLPKAPPAGLEAAIMERALGNIDRILAEQDFETEEELEAFLSELLKDGPIPERPAETPLQKAQELIYQAWEARSRQQRVRLAQQALEISPDCADAYVVLAEETARTAEEALDLYAQGVAAGERALGPKAFEEYRDRFWGVIETRPYMRARLGLALALWECGRREEAIGHAWSMLELNPNDNQGVRYALLGWLLESGDQAGTLRLLKQYEDDPAAAWKYGRALHSFQTEGDTAHSCQLLRQAMDSNSYVPAYLVGRRRIPLRRPEFMSLGNESEAVVYAQDQIGAWRNTPGALEWLRRRWRAE
ncbi:MAG: hypothetical protein HPY83_11765 [Anaerolineae bacterium]|nr:hypothetical protein [Anaerolineae bacterium]